MKKIELGSFKRINKMLKDNEETAYLVSRDFLSLDNCPVTITVFLDLMSITFVGRYGKRPMHLFGTLGVLSFFFGFLILVYLAVTKIFFGVVGMTNRPVFYLGILTVIVGAQLFVAGFLGELIARNGSDRNQYFISDKTNF